MITDAGKVFIKRYMGVAAGAISVGVGDTPESNSDSRLDFELVRVPIIVTDYDFINDELVFKAELDEDISGEIREIGVWTSEVNAAAGNQESKILTTFDLETEDWDTSSFDGTHTRIGTTSLLHTPAASGSLSSVMTGSTIDFIDYTSSDEFILAYYVANSNCASVAVRLRTDDANYYEHVITSPAVGYYVERVNIGSAVATGAPDWADINEVEVVTTATAAGAAEVHYDGLRIEDIDSIDPEYGLIARHVLLTPVEKKEGIIKDIEYSISVTIA